jgi:chaperonin cofactor prefoldin
MNDTTSVTPTPLTRRDLDQFAVRVMEAAMEARRAPQPAAEHDWKAVAAKAKEADMAIDDVLSELDLIQSRAAGLYLAVTSEVLKVSKTDAALAILVSDLEDKLETFEALVYKAQNRTEELRALADGRTSGDVGS